MSVQHLCYLAAVCLLATACGEKAPPKAAAAPRQMPGVPVTVAKATETSVPLELHAIGNVEAWSTIQIKSQVGGILTRVDFTEGQDVRKGQVLFEIDSRPYEEAIKQAEAAIARD